MEVLEGIPLIQRQYDLLKTIFSKVFVVTNEPSCYAFLGCEVYKDLYESKSPLVGIYTGLEIAKPNNAFFFACDMPFLNPELITYMCSLLGETDIVVPRTREGYEPLHAIYSPLCLKEIRVLLEMGMLKVSELFKRVTVRLVTEEELARFGSYHRFFFNVNTKADMARLNFQLRNQGVKK